MKQKVAACFGAFVTDLDGRRPALGTPKHRQRTVPRSRTSSPGTIAYLKPGQTSSSRRRRACRTRRSACGRCATSRSASVFRTRSSPATTRRSTTARLAWRGSRTGERHRVARAHAHPAVLRRRVGLGDGAARGARGLAGAPSRDVGGAADGDPRARQGRSRVPPPRAHRRDDVGADGSPARLRPDGAARRDPGVQRGARRARHRARQRPAQDDVERSAAGRPDRELGRTTGHCDGDRCRTRRRT
jgi:hypothetical protein